MTSWVADKAVIINLDPNGCFERLTHQGATLLLPTKVEIDPVDQIWKIYQRIMVSLHLEYLNVSVQLRAAHFIGIGPLDQHRQPIKRHFLGAIRDVSGIAQEEIKRRSRRRALPIFRLELTIRTFPAIVPKCEVVPPFWTVLQLC